MNKIITQINKITSDSIKYRINKLNFFSNQIIIYNGNSDAALQKFWIYIDIATILNKNCSYRVQVFNILTNGFGNTVNPSILRK